MNKNYVLEYCCWISLETGFLCLRLEYWEVDCRLRYGGGAWWGGGRVPLDVTLLRFTRLGVMGLLCELWASKSPSNKKNK